jgi:hypothetical protein
MMIDISKTGAITDWAGLAGKTIVAVEDVPRGRYAHTVDAVLIETACFRQIRLRHLNFCKQMATICRRQSRNTYYATAGRRRKKALERR